MGELKNKAIKGTAWSIIDKIFVKLISFIIGIVVARILTPADYGVIGMIMVFIIVANILVDSGISQALVQRKDCNQEDRSTAFIFNIVISGVCYTILFFAAPFIATFYNMPILTPVLRILGLNIIILSFATVQRAILQSSLNFKAIAIVNISGVIISGAIGVYLAYSGLGVWALVIQQMLSAAVSTAVYWIVSRWRPTLTFSVASLKALWHFGSRLLFAGLVATIVREIYTITIGKFYRATELGYYSRAVQTTDMVSTSTSEMINAVTFPILSLLQDERERLVNVYSRMLGMTAFFIFPIMTLLAVIAKPLTVLLLTDKWLPLVPLMQWLCFARMFTPISGLNMNILNAVGRSDLFLKLDLSKIPIMLLGMAITIPIGVKAIVIGNFITTFICYFVNAYLPGKMFDFGIMAQFRIFWRIAIASGIMAIVTISIISVVDSPLIQVISGGISAIICYLLTSRLLNIGEFKEVIIAFRTILLKK